ncbi:MAG: LURP-one-related family protein [Lachnospiraceae bacterium]|nr:LURP-one-related family protein [Lachnospiraceae bacterium]
MGQLLIKQKVFSWTDTYDVYDQSGNPKYYVKADFFSIGHRIRVFDKMSGREVGLIQEKILRIFKEFEITINGFSQGIIKKQFSILRPKYNVDYKGWRLEGDFLQWNYDVYEQSRLVVHISKQLFRWGDTYVLDIANDADELPALMVAIAMDAARCSEDDNRNSMM